MFMFTRHDDNLLKFVLRAADRSGQQVARYDEYITTCPNARAPYPQYFNAYRRVKIIFLDGRHIRGWLDGNRWRYADRTWERYDRHS
jgi:hypothetical protein